MMSDRHDGLYAIVVILQGQGDYDDRMTDEGTLVIPESISRLQMFEMAFNIKKFDEMVTYGKLIIYGYEGCLKMNN